MTDIASTVAVSRQNFRHANVLFIHDESGQGLLIGQRIRESLPEVELVVATAPTQVMAQLSVGLSDEFTWPRLILLALSTPDRTHSWQVLTQIKALPAPANQIPVVLIGQLATAADVQEAYDRGCSSFVTLPESDAEWPAYFSELRVYWWETALLPQLNYLP